MGEKRHDIRVFWPRAAKLASGCSEVDISQTFDELNRITAINHAHLQKTQHNEWDAAGNRTAMWVDGIPNSRADYSWDSRNRLAAIAHQAMGNVAYSYNAAGAKTTLTYPNGIVCSYTYDPNGRLTSLDYRRPDNSQVFFENLTYDARGNITQRVDDEGTHDYQYDALDQLTRAAYPDATWEAFAYDRSGNRSSLTTAGGVAVYQVDDADQLLSVSGPGQSEVTIFGWTPNGEMASQHHSAQTTATSYAWNTRSMMVVLSLPRGQVLTYTYLPEQWLGWNLSAGGPTVPTSHFLWDPSTGNQLADLGSALDAVRLHGQSLQMDSAWGEHEVAGGMTHVVGVDHLGSVTKLSGPGGALAGSQVFAAFGQVRGPPVNASLTRFGFTGRDAKSLPSLVSLRARLHNSLAGGFLAQDPIRFEGGLNLLGYVSNNPLRFTDPLGQQFADREFMTPEQQEAERLLLDDHPALVGFYATPVAGALAIEMAGAAAGFLASYAGAYYQRAAMAIGSWTFAQLAASRLGPVGYAAYLDVINNVNRMSHIFAPKHLLQPLIVRFGTLHRVVFEVTKRTTPIVESTIQNGKNFAFDVLVEGWTVHVRGYYCNSRMWISDFWVPQGSKFLGVK